MSKSIWIVAAFALLALVSCGGQAGQPTDNLGDATPVIAGEGLNGLATPREVADSAAVLAMDGSTRSYLTTTATYSGLDGHGVTQPLPDFFLHFEGMEEQIAYTSFIVDRLDDNGTTLSQFSLDMDWEGETPSGANGFYIGVPDYEGNKWEWRGPAVSPQDVLDFTDRQLTGHPQEFRMDLIMVVNYSAVASTLRYINFTTSNPDDVKSDEVAYFITNEDGEFAINRMLAADLSSIEQIYAPGVGTEIADLYFGQPQDTPVLVFNQRTDGGDWEVWQVYPDGSGLQMRYDDEGDVRFAGFRPDTNHEFVIRGEFDTTGTIERMPEGSDTPDLTFSLPGRMVGAPRWYGHSSYDLSFAVPGYTEEGELTMINYLELLTIPRTYFYELTNNLDAGTVAFDPYYFFWVNGQFSYTPMTLFSAKGLADATYDIRAHMGSVAASRNDKLFIVDEEYDLRYPSISQDNRLIGVVACEPGEDVGTMYVQSSFYRVVDKDAAVAENVAGAALWYDPTPIELEF